MRANATLIFDRRTGGQGGEGMTSAGQWCVDISPHLATSRHISPHLAASRRICPVSRRISPISRCIRWVENVLEECDAPEEFYYDAAQQRLYYSFNSSAGEPPPAGLTLTLTLALALTLALTLTLALALTR